MKYLLILFLIQSTNLLPSQASIIWQKTYGGNGSEFLRGGVLPTSFGYIIAGDSESDFAGNKRIENHGIWLIGIDSTGKILWQRGYCDPLSSLWAFTKTPDENYIISANSYSDSCMDKSQKSYKADIWIIKIDESGEILWEKTLSGDDNDVAPRLISTLDGGYLIGVSSDSQKGLSKLDSSKGRSDLWIVKLDSLGNIDWQKSIGGTHEDGLTSIIEVSDGYILGASSSSVISGDKTNTNYGAADYWVIKLDKIGNIKWQRNFGGSSQDNLYSLIETDDHYIVLAGFSRSDISGNKNTIQVGKGDWWVVKLDSLGNEIWQKNYGGTEPESEFVYLKSGKNGEFYLYGSSASGPTGNKTTLSQGSMDYWLLNLNGTGDILWQHSFGGNSIDYLRSLLIESDSSFILSGQSQSVVSGDKNESGYGEYDYWVLKIKMDPITATYHNKESEVIVFPNPTNDFLYIYSDIEFDHAIILNLIGNNYYQLLNGKHFIDLSEFSKGIYIIELFDKNGNFSNLKLIKKL